MNIVTLDFETFYDTGFSLSRLTTEEYIKDEQFQVIGFAIKINNGSVEWHTGSHEELQEVLANINWKESMLLCHNTMFDGAILKWVFNQTPFAYLDTLSMARAIHGINAGGSLKALAKRYNLDRKSTRLNSSH